MSYLNRLIVEKARLKTEDLLKVSDILKMDMYQYDRELTKRAEAILKQERK